MNILDRIQGEINDVLVKVDQQQMQQLCEEISKAKHIFLDGEGRSGFSAKGFAMRLMHLGYTVYFIGETVTPAMQAGDLFIGVSGSGTSGHVMIDLEKAAKAGCRIAAITSKGESPLGKAADITMIIPGTVKGETGEARKSIQLLSSLFDQCLHIVTDAICLMLSYQMNLNNETATKKHY